jgi:hypothetical protein
MRNIRYFHEDRQALWGQTCLLTFEAFAEFQLALSRITGCRVVFIPVRNHFVINTRVPDYLCPLQIAMGLTVYRGA